MLYSVIIFLSAILILLAVILMLKVNIVAEYLRDNDDDNISVSFFTLKELLKYKYEVPLIDVDNKGVKYRLVRERGKKDTTTGVEKQRTGFIQFIQKVFHMWSVYKDNGDKISRLMCLIKKYVTFDEFKLRIREGTGDAAATGLVNGLLWATSGLVITRLFKSFKIKSKKFKSDIDIEPDYEMKDFNVDLYCIFHTRLVHIILVLVFVLLHKSSFKDNKKKVTGGEINGRASY